MICVRDIIQLPSIPCVEALSAEEDWLDRGVCEVAVMDAEPLTGAFDVFYSGDAVFSSLGFSGGDTDRINEGILRLLERDIACVLVKDTLPWDPSNEVIAASRRARIPLFRYRHGLLEQIITDARNLIALEAEQDLWEEKLTKLTEMPLGAAARAFLREAFGIDGVWVQAGVFSPGESDSLVLGALKNHLQAAFAKNRGCLVMRFRDRIVVLFAMDAQERQLDAARASQLIAGFGTHPHAGTSEVLLAEDCSIALQEAQAACDAAQQANGVTADWATLNVAAFAAARPHSPLLDRACAAGLDRLRAYDKEAGSNLEESVRTYVACGGDVSRTAEHLLQHPNSVRNRLSRVRSVLSLTDATDKELFAYLAMICL
ncbi:MAG: PucR family transcriptional regulator [Eggerthellaceae bacterium]|nr:PucR family transcriptional regulator [Eggerthellaceae bacterium]